VLEGFLFLFLFFSFSWVWGEGWELGFNDGFNNDAILVLSSFGSKR
jgi:hypothetical protein